MSQSHLHHLLEQILSETPDRPLSQTADSSDKLKEAGFDVNSVENSNWTATDAVTFAVDAKYGVVMWLANSADDRAYQHSDLDDFFTGMYRDSKSVSKGVVGMDWKRYRILAKWHEGVFGSGDRANAQMMMGRLWRKTGFVSFWNKKDDVMKKWPVIRDFITNMKLNPKKCAYEFIDKMDVELYDELTGDSSSSTKVVDPEVLRQMHTDPTLKKNMLGTVGKSRDVRDGYYSRVGDGVVRNGDLLQEDPDSVDVTTGDDLKKLEKAGIDVTRLKHKQVSQDMPDSVPFACDLHNNVILFSKSDEPTDDPLVHDDLFGNMAMFALYPNLYTLERLPHGWTITPNQTDDWDDVASPDNTIGPVTFGGLMNKDSVYDYIENHADVLDVPSRQNTQYTLGRMWWEIPLVSFWSEMARSIEPKSMNLLVYMLKLMHIDPKKTAYEFLDHEGTLFLYDELSSSSAPKMSKADYLERLKKQHLDPQAKRDLNKDAEKPDKYGGILPAQYHAWSRTSDGVIKLGDLLK